MKKYQSIIRNILILKFIRDLGVSLNSAQKIILAVVVPLILFVITFIVADEENGPKPFIWILFLGIIGYFEFQLYSNKGLIEDLRARLNSIQKTIVALVVPLILFVLTYIFTENYFDRWHWDGWYGYGYVKNVDAFDMDATGFFWVLFLVIIGYFEFQLYSNKNNNVNEMNLSNTIHNDQTNNKIKEICQNCKNPNTTQSKLCEWCGEVI